MAKIQDYEDFKVSERNRVKSLLQTVSFYIVIIELLALKRTVLTLYQISHKKSIITDL